MRLVEDGLPHDQCPEMCACAGLNDALRLQLSELSQQCAINLNPGKQSGAVTACVA